jgi:hypothetical protein
MKAGNSIIAESKKIKCSVVSFEHIRNEFGKRTRTEAYK